MPQVGFKKEFVEKVLTGQKPFTLRALRKDGRDAKAGQTLYMFTGLRSKACKKFTEKPCRFAVTIFIRWREIFIPTIGYLLRDESLQLFSRLDGFNNYDELCRFHKCHLIMEAKKMRLVAWITREELKQLFVK